MEILAAAGIFYFPLSSSIWYSRIQAINERVITLEKNEYHRLGNGAWSTGPFETKPSMEACCMDVMANLRASGMLTRSVADGHSSPTFLEDTTYLGYSLVLID
jgi:hypothetical protein